jgi:hypothetical protein
VYSTSIFFSLWGSYEVTGSVMSLHVNLVVGVVQPLCACMLTSNVIDMLSTGYPLAPPLEAHLQYAPICSSPIR